VTTQKLAAGFGSGILDEIALEHGTDKSSVGHNFTPIYEQLFEPWREKPVALLELGVAEGYSLRTWADYFTHPDAVIVGIDLQLGPANLPARVVEYIADQTEIPPELQGWSPDIIIDDASHISSKTIGSFNAWFPLLKPGGIYAVEDLHTSYGVGCIGALSVASAPHETSKDPDRPPPANPQGHTAMQFLKRLADEVQSFAVEPAYRLGFDIESVCFHPDLVVVRKKSDQPMRLNEVGWRMDLPADVQWRRDPITGRVHWRRDPTASTSQS
jgi:8-demethyl-8-(2-methoxy-alpha-L-rhamnosyl)tetracenomycin-C 3'-O-methyltransferase